MRASQLVLVVKNLLAEAGDTGDGGSISGSGISSEGKNCNPHYCSCLENPIDRGDWQAIVHKVPNKQSDMTEATADIHKVLQYFKMDKLRL